MLRQSSARSPALRLLDFPLSEPAEPRLWQASRFGPSRAG